MGMASPLSVVLFLFTVLRIYPMCIYLTSPHPRHPRLQYPPPNVLEHQYVRPGNQVHCLQAKTKITTMKKFIWVLVSQNTLINILNICTFKILDRLYLYDWIIQLSCLTGTQWPTIREQKFRGLIIYPYLKTVRVFTELHYV